MAADVGLDLEHLGSALTPIFEVYPVGNFCDICAQEVSQELRKTEFEVAIVTLRNETMPGQSHIRPPFIHGRHPDGQPVLLADTGFHQVARLLTDGIFYYLDALVFMHYGLQAVDEMTYRGLFLYSDGVEFTDIQEV